jgi:hypothetical protein
MRVRRRETINEERLMRRWVSESEERIGDSEKEGTQE